MASVLPNPAHATDAPDTITMYGADWCGDCLRAKAFFADNNVEYDYVDLVEHEAGTPIVLERNGGVQKIPVIIYPDNTHLTEPSNDELAAKLAAAGAGAGAESTGDESTGEAVGDGPADKSSGDDYTIVENRDEGRFELHHNNEILSVADFSERSGGVVVIAHVGTDPAHRGQGNAGRLMEGLLGVLGNSERTIVPVCPYAAHYIKENPQHQNLVA